MNTNGFLKIHRYLGLLLAAFLVIAGVSGSILVFYTEINALLNPEIFRIDETGQQPLDPGTLAEAVEAADHRVLVNYVPLIGKAERAVVVYIEPRTNPASGLPFEVPYDEVFINPVTAEITGNRVWGECCSRINFVPMVHKIHNRLLLPSSIGRPIWGGVAIVWVLMVLIGMVLTWPKSGPVLTRWKSAWSVKRGLPFTQLNFQLHRAVGLWFWLMILMIALTGVPLTLERQVFLPVITLFSPLSPSLWDTTRVEDDSVTHTQPRISFTAALDSAQAHASSIGMNIHFSSISYSHQRKFYRLQPGHTLTTGLGKPIVMVDSLSGQIVGDGLARESTFTDKISAANQSIHGGDAGGLPGRLIVFITGLAVALLSVTGPIMWWRRRRNRGSG